MIKVSSINDFQKFISIANDKNVDCVIFGSENETGNGLMFPGKEEKITIFSYTFYLSCKIFDVYISEKIQINKKSEITGISSQFNYIPVDTIKLDYKKLKIDNKDYDIYNGIIKIEY